MPAWKKVIVSGSDGSFRTVYVANSVTASIVSASQFTGSLFGTSSNSITASYALNAGNVFPYSGTAVISGSLIVTGSERFIGNAQFTGSLLLTQSAISTVDYIDFTKTANPAHSEGRIHWVDDTKTLQVDTDVSNLMIELGHQQVVRVRNENPFTIAKGKIIYISGSSGNRPLIYTSSIETDTVSAGTVGMVAADIAQNNNGYVITRGTIRDINTNAYLAGTLLYLSTSGDYTTTAPEAPLHEVRLGKVVTQATAGIIYIDIMNGYEIGELHDVVDTNGTIGDLLVRSGSSPNNVFKNSKQLTGSYGVTGSWNVLGSISASGGFTGSLLGTSSFASTASYVRNLYITASSTAPASPTDNELWYDADNGKTYIRFNDGTSTQWVLQSDPTIDVNTSLQTLQEVTDLGTTTTHAISITNTTNATDSSSGAFIVGGGAGFGLDVWARKFYGDGSSLTGVVATNIVETDTLQSVTTRGTDTSASIFVTNTTNSTNAGLGALRVSGGLFINLDINARSITASLQGTSSWANYSTTSSFIEYVNVANKPSLFSGSSQVQLNQINGTTFADALFTFPGDVVVQGNVTAEQLIVSTSVYFVTTSFSSGSTVFGNDTLDTHKFTGSLFVTGAAFISGSTQVTGSFRVLGGITATSLTGSITASSLQGAILNSQLQNSNITVGTTTISLGSSSTTIVGLSSISSTSITASVVSASSFSGSISAASLVGDIILGTQTSGQYASTITGGSGLTATAANANDGTAYTIDAVAGAGISLTAPTNDAINIDTGSAHFTGGVTNRLNTLNVLSGSVSSPSQGTISVGGFTNIDLGVQTTDNVTFNSLVVTTNITASIISASTFISGGQIIATKGLTGSLTASSLIGDIILGTQTSGQYASTITGGSGLTATSANANDGTAYTLTLNTSSAHFLDGVKNELNTEGVISGSVSSPSQGTISVGGFTNIDLGVQTGDNVTFNTVTGTNGLTGSLTASSLQGLINNNQLRNSSVTIGNTSLSLGGTATTITGLTSITSTNFVGTASYVTGSIYVGSNPALSASYALTASFALNAGGGGVSDFPYTGSAIITGSLTVTGSIDITGALTASIRQGYIWVGGPNDRSIIIPTSSLGSGGSSGANAKLNQSTPSTTWSFDHFLGERYPNITVFDSNGGVLIPGRIETIDANNLNVYFDVATAGIVVASVGGVATTINAESASYYTGNEIVIGTTTLTPAVTSSLGATTTTVSRVWTGSFSGAFWDYVVNNTTNYRAGTVMGVWNKVGSAQFTDTSTPDIGDTSQLTFGVVINGEYAELRSTATTSGWNVKTFVRKI